MSNPLTPSDLMRQANDTAETYMNNAVRIIDKKFGAGFAQKNPRLVGDFMRTASLDFITVIQHQNIQSFSNSIDGLADASEGNHE